MYESKLYNPFFRERGMIAILNRWGFQSLRWAAWSNIEYITHGYLGDEYPGQSGYSYFISYHGPSVYVETMSAMTYRKKITYIAETWLSENITWSEIFTEMFHGIKTIANLEIQL